MCWRIASICDPPCSLFQMQTSCQSFPACFGSESTTLSKSVEPIDEFRQNLTSCDEANDQENSDSLMKKEKESLFTADVLS